jgi:hypothetical protein
VRRVNRRLPLVLSVAAIVAFSAGCTTFSDSANVARVGEATLTEDDFRAQLTELGAPSDQLLPAEAVRGQITTWIQEQVAAGDMPAVDADQAAELYDAGVAASGTACFSGIVVEDRETAARIADELGDGADFAELLEAENLDPSLGAAGGDIGCITSSQVDEAADLEFVQVAASLSAQNPVDISPLLDTQGNEFAWVVLSFRPFAELTPADADNVTTTIETATRLATADVFVDSRYGTFDATTGQVVALG